MPRSIDDVMRPVPRPPVVWTFRAKVLAVVAFVAVVGVLAFTMPVLVVVAA